MIGDSTKHIFKLFNVKTIIAVFDATFAVAKRKPEIFRFVREFEPLNSTITVQHPTTYQLAINPK